ncbi:MAG: hypothetical protein ACPGJV_10290 [Bacteriovoracaceae bacterium]
MFYSNDEVKIQNQFSSIDGKQIYTGTYWDEFGLSQAFLPYDSDVLVLGLAEGACVRPIHASGRVGSLDCVDYDGKLLAKCRSLFEKKFREIPFQTYESCAFDFLGQTTKKYDLIWIDLYLKESYSPIYFNPYFWKLASEKLNPRGRVLVNSFGLPMHLKPFSTDNPQFKFLNFINLQFDEIRVIPYRRNMTLVIEDKKSPLNFSVPSLKLCDQMVMKTFAHKYYHAEKLSDLLKIKTSSELGELKLESIDVSMRAGWKLFIEKLNDRIRDLKLKRPLLKAPREIRDLVQDEVSSLSLLEDMLKKKSREIIFFPVFLSGEVNCSELDVTWFVNWFFQNHNRLRLEMKEIFFSYFLPLITSIVINPNASSKSYSFRMNQVLDFYLQELKLITIEGLQ